MNAHLTTRPDTEDQMRDSLRKYLSGIIPETIDLADQCEWTSLSYLLRLVLLEASNQSALATVSKEKEEAGQPSD